MKKRLDLSEALIGTLRKQNLKQSEDIIDLQSRSMRDNLIFTGIPERDGENPTDCLKKFLRNEMKVPNAEDVNFDRVHRTGPPNRPNRTIVAKLSSSNSKGVILAHDKT